jgi:hypothetical protein
MAQAAIEGTAAAPTGYATGFVSGLVFESGGLSGVIL